MRISGNPFRGIGPRSAVALGLLVAVAAITLASGVATADKPKHKTQKQQPVPISTAAASARAITHRLTAIAAADKKLRKKLSIAAKKHKGVAKTTFELQTAADGTALYVTSIVAKSLDRRHGGLINIRLQLDRTDIATGVKTRLLDKLNAYPLGLYARGGKVALETGRFLSAKEPGGSRNDLVARLAVYSASNSDPQLGLKSVAQLTFDGPSDQPCGHFALLGGLSDIGDPLVADVDSPCDSKTAKDLEDFEANLELWKSDGTRRDLGTVPLESIFYSQAYLLSGSKLLMPSPYEPATAIKDIDSGDISNLWTPNSAVADVASDGTVALVGYPSGAFDDYVGLARSAGSSSGSSSSGSSEESIEATPLPPGVKLAPPPPRKYPFVLFPGGDPDNPLLLSPSRQSIRAMRICGSNLYVLDSLKQVSSRYEELPYYSDFGLYGTYENGEFEVQRYDLQGALVRRIEKTGKINFAGLGCNGDKLLLVKQIKGHVAAKEIAP